MLVAVLEVREAGEVTEVLAAKNKEEEEGDEHGQARRKIAFTLLESFRVVYGYAKEQVNVCNEPVVAANAVRFEYWKCVLLPTVAQKNALNCRRWPTNFQELSPTTWKWSV
ncbi:hypothetical protein PC123_g20373 [Phytophthora cactorum]|nr:hypothetical protein PC123_g20373 [Phytophthora cactorum]